VSQRIKPLVKTVLYGLAAGVIFAPLVALAGRAVDFRIAFGLALVIVYSGYGVLLTRWGAGRLSGLLYPMLVLLLGAVFVPTVSGIFLMGMGIFSWMRSGVCFIENGRGRLLSELVLSIGGGLWTLYLVSPQFSPVDWAMGIWLFFLIQSLYFLVPGNWADKRIGDTDPFESARRKAEAIVGEMEGS